MRIIPEKVFVHADARTGEMVVVMDGFRMTLNRSEGELLRDGLDHGLKQLSAAAEDSRRPALAGADFEKPEPKKLTAI
jgi:hypothetical protein